MTQTTVYLLDDEPDLVELLCEVVQIAGLNARGYTRPSDFFEQVTTYETGSILVLDLQMPELDGIEVMRRLASLKHRPAMILISGHDTGILHAAERLGRAHNLKILASLSKPVPLDTFQRLLEQHAANDNGYQLRDAPALGRDITQDELELAIHNDQLILHYQPQIEIATGTLVGVEALVRWQHPEHGLIYPDRFLPLVEHNGWMDQLTHWVIDTAIRQRQQWRNANFAIAVNISANNITSLTLPEQLTELLMNNQVDPSWITLEVTESMLMGELVTSLEILTRLRMKGIGLSIDDFGTGYSSLSQLHRVPFTELKIDLSFVINMTVDAEARAIVKTCIMLGHELNMRVVAEGVETHEHLQLLKQMDCDIAQGYFFSKPVPAAAITPMLP